MSSVKATIAVSGNVPKLVSAISLYRENQNIKFSDHSFITKPKYHLFLINLQDDLENVSQSLITLYEECRENKSKILVCLIFDNEIDREKVLQFQTLLNDLGGNDHLHRIAVTRDVYTGINQGATTALDREIENIFKGDSINISIKGRNLLYPLALQDFIEALIKILFLNSTSGKTLYLLGEPIIDLELAYIIKKIVIDDKPNFQINSSGDNIPADTETDNLSNTTQVDLNWSPSTDFESSLKALYIKIKSEPEENFQPDVEITGNKISQVGEFLNNNVLQIKQKLNFHHVNSSSNSFNKRKFAGKILLIGALSYLCVVGIFVFSLYQSFQNLAKSLNYLREGNLIQSVLYVNNTKTYDQIAINIYWPIRPLVGLISSTSDDELHNMFSFNQYLRSSLESLQQSYVLSEKIYLSFVDSSQNNNIDDQTLALKSSLGQIYDNLNQIDIMVNSGKLPKWLIDKLKENPDFKKLGNLEIQLTQAMKLLNILPAVSSQKSSRQIAIIVQDQDELRSLGGVIKYLIVFNVDKGKIANIQIFNQSDIDNHNDGSVKAPEAVARITGADNWKFRDMSYFGDYSQTSQYLTWFLDKIISVKPDVLISINKSMFEKLLTNTGSIQISGKSINKESLKSKIGEADSGDLRLVIDYYIGLYRSQKLTLAELSRVVIDEVENSDLYFWAKDISIENSISNLPFSGVINPFNCHSALANYKTCISQTTYLTESNFTIAPINQFLTREVVHIVTLKQNESQHEYQLKYHFTTDLSSLNRDYRIIYQLYISGKSNLVSVSVDGQELQSTSFIKQQYNQFDYYQIPLALSTNIDHQVKIIFNSAVYLSSDINNTAYSLSEIRQSGLKDGGYGLILNLPENTHPALITSEADTKPQQLFYRFPTKTATFGVGLGLIR